MCNRSFLTIFAVVSLIAIPIFAQDAPKETSKPAFSSETTAKGLPDEHSIDRRRGADNSRPHNRQKTKIPLTPDSRLSPQDDPEGTKNGPNPANLVGPVSKKTDGPWWSVTNAMTMSAIVLIFGVIVISFATYLIRHGKQADAVLKMFGTILIIVMAIFLVVVGYSDAQIAPVMGLLGTVAGYLLGKETKDT